MALDAGAATTFSYVSEDGAFDVQVTPRAAGLRAVVRVQGAAAKPAEERGRTEREWRAWRMRRVPAAARPSSPGERGGIAQRGWRAGHEPGARSH